MDKKLLGLAALASAGLASVCCIGPIVVAGSGFASLGLAVGLTRYRPFFLVMTVVALAAAFYRAYRKRPVACADGACELRSGSRATKAGAWTLAALAAALATFPNWSGHVAARSVGGVPPGGNGLELKVTGMDCAACTTSIELAIEKVPGVHSAAVDFNGGRAWVVADAGVESAAIIGAVAAAGYKAELLREKRL